MSGEDYRMSLEMFNRNIPKNFVPEYDFTPTTTYQENNTQQQQWQRHYPVKEEQEKAMEIFDIHNSYSNNSQEEGDDDVYDDDDDDDVDPLNQYTIQYFDDNKLKGRVANNSDDKGYRTFLVADYVDYQRETNISKCLIRNCEKPLSGRRTGNIKRHYEKVHNFVIVHSGTNKDKEKLADDVISKPSRITVNLNKYFDYDPLTNKSYCKMPGCTAALMSRKPNNIMRHYSLVHNFKIGAEDMDKEDNADDNLKTNRSSLNIPLEDLVFVDKETEQCHCLFITCKEILPQDIELVERHYNDLHKIVIARNGENIPNRFYRKRMYRYVHQPFESDQEYVESKLMEYMQQTDPINIKHEEMQEEELPHCSKMLINNPLITRGKRGFGRFELKKYVDYDQFKNISKCLIKHCKRSMSGCLVGNIKRHYLSMHNFVILHGSRIPFEEIEQMSDVSREQIEDLVAYDKNSTYQCLFLECGGNLEDNLFSIKKHYLEVHKILIVRYADYITQRKRRYKELQQQHQLSEMDYCDEEELPLMASDQFGEEDLGQNMKIADKDEQVEKVNYGKMCVEKYVDYDEEKNLSKCLIKHCKRSMSGCLVGNIKRHYLTMHNFVILHGTRLPYPEMEDLPSMQEDLLPYFIEMSSQQCLLLNCNKTLTKQLTQIKEHYWEEHKIVINNESYKISMPSLYRGKGFMSSNIYRNPESILPHEEGQQSIYLSQKSFTNTLNPLGRKGFGKFNMAHYVDYNKEKNLAKCLIKHCKRSMSGCIVGNIKRHYKRMHNFVILHGIRMLSEEFQEIFDPAVIEELVVYDIASASYRCIFHNCQEVLEKNLASLKKHYYKIHNVAIAKDAECGMKRKQQRRYHELYETSFESEFLEEESCSVRNEYLTEDEGEVEEEDDPMNDINPIDCLEETLICPIKKERLSDEEDPTIYSKPNINHSNFNIKKSNLKLTHPHIKNLLEQTPNLKPSMEKTKISNSSKENSTSVQINLTKQSFLNLCLGLVIQRDMPLQYFDDGKYFKPLLAPYEQIFACNITTNKMQNMMVKADRLIVEDLRNTLSNKIVCLELYVLKRLNIYYVIINVRFLMDKMICNKLIGSFPLIETTKLLPLNEYLNKFNIDKQQVYMKTIIPEFHNDDQINNICENICKYNSDIKYHPIYEVQTIFTYFIRKYSSDIKKWQELSGYNETDTSMENFKEFSRYLEENCSESEERKLQAARDFFKALQIFWNFMDKLRDEQYVAGDFYRDLLCCELGLKGEYTKNQNSYADELYEEFCKFKNRMLESGEFIAALYLDARFNFLGTRLIGDDEQNKGKLYLCEIWENFKNYLECSTSHDTLPNNETSNEDLNDDEYALLTQHINDTMPAKTNISIQYKLSNFIPTKRLPISMDILKYWHSNSPAMEDINELTKIAFTHSASQFMLLDLEQNFSAPTFGATHSDKFDKFLIKCNPKILEDNIDLILKEL